MSRHTFILERRRSDQMLKPQWLTRNERYSSHRFDFAFCPQFIVWMKFEVAAFAPWLFSSLYEIHRSALYFDFFTSSSLSFFLPRFILTHWQSSLFWWTFAELWSKTCFWLTISLIIHNNMCYCYCFVFIFLSQVFYTLSFQFKRLFRRLCALARLFFLSFGWSSDFCISFVLQDRALFYVMRLIFYLSAQFHQISLCFCLVSKSTRMFCAY